MTINVLLKDHLCGVNCCSRDLFEEIVLILCMITCLCRSIISCFVEYWRNIYMRRFMLLSMDETWRNCFYLDKKLVTTWSKATKLVTTWSKASIILPGYFKYCQSTRLWPYCNHVVTILGHGFYHFVQLVRLQSNKNPFWK